MKPPIPNRSILAAFLLLTLATGAVAQGVLSPMGLAGWWPAESSALDMISQSAGQLHGGASYAPGFVGQAFAFNGVDGYVEVTNSPALTLTNELTIEFWVKRLRLDYYDFIVEKGGDWTGSANDYTVALHIADYGYCLTFLFSGGWRGAGTIGDTNWHHCAVVVRNGDTDPTFYIDGVQSPVTQRAGAQAITLRASTRPLHIGAEVDPVTGWQYYSKALIDELSIYDRALGQSEIAAIFAAGSAGKIRSPLAPTIVSQPKDLDVRVDSNAAFQVEASGDPPFQFQWRKGDSAIQGAVTNPLVIPSTRLEDAGVYSVLVSNTVGWTVSSNATLIVREKPCTNTIGGLISWWPLDGDLVDGAGTNNGSKLTGAVYTNGVVGQALAFDGAGGFAEVPDSPELRVTNELSIEFWVKRQRLDYYDFIIEKGGDWTFGRNNYTVALHIQPYNYCLTFLFAGGARGGGRIGDLEWHHCAVVAKQGDADPLLYIDGVLQSITYRDGESSIHLYPSTAPLHIGSQIDFNYFGKAVIDDVALYNRLLTQAEVENIYQSGAHGKCLPATPTIYSQPKSQAASAGSDVELEVRALGATPLQYQWFFNDKAIDGANGAALARTNITTQDAGTYWVVVTNAYGSITSSNAVVDVSVLAPTISMQPTDRTALVGSETTFAIGVTGSPILSYQWFFKKNPIEGATNSAFTLTNITLGDAGIYAVQITNSAGVAISSNAVLTVKYPPARVQCQSVAAKGGKPVVIPVVLTANGIENALAFSLSFAPSLFAFSDITLGSNAPGAALVANTTQAQDGRVGVALALPAGQTWTKGVQEVAKIVLLASPSSSSKLTTIAFSNTPVPRQLADANGGSLEATFTPLDIQIEAADFEADVAPRSEGDKLVDLSDWVVMGRYAARLDYPATTSEFQRADCAPLETGGDGRITVVDWVQAGRYAAHLDAVRAVSGPTEEQLAPQVIPSRNGLSRSLRVIDKTVISGRTVSVPLQLSAVGDENALGFSIQFDPKRLVFQKAALETGSPGVVLNLNDTEASLGRLAAAVARPSGKTFDPKAQNVLTLEFRAIAPAPEAALVSLTDNPVPCEISSAGASRLSGSFLAGTVTISDGPLVNAELNADGLKLSWPSWADLFVPESTPIGPTPGWQEIVASRLTNSTSVSVQLPLPDKPTFFRLREP